MSTRTLEVAALPLRRDGSAAAGERGPDDPTSRRAKRPRAGLAAATVAASGYVIGLPLLRPTGPANTAPVDLAALALLIAVGVAWLNRRARLCLPYAVPVAVFAFAGVMGAVAGPVPGRGLLAVLQDLLLLVVCGALATVAREPAARRQLLRMWAISSLCWALALIVGVAAGVSELSGITAREGARASLTMGDPNMAANYFVTSIFVLLGSRWPTRRLSRVIAVAILFAATLLTGSNGGVLAVVVGALMGLAVGACLRRHRNPLWGFLAVAALVVVVVGAAPVARWQQDVVAYAQASSVKIVRDSVGRQDQSSSTRHTLLDESMHLAKGEPVLGNGPGSTKTLLESRQYPYAKEAHDDYLAAVTERGTLGVLGLALLFVAVGNRLVAAIRLLAGERGSPLFSPSHAVGCAAAFATSAMFYEVLHFRQLWVFLALLAADSVRGRDGTRTNR